jgi:hypothetical protein
MKLLQKSKRSLQKAIFAGSSSRQTGKTLIEFPLTVGVAAATGVLLLAPLLAAVGALAAIVTDLTIVVEREE